MYFLHRNDISLAVALVCRGVVGLFGIIIIEELVVVKFSMWLQKVLLLLPTVST